MVVCHFSVYLHRFDFSSFLVNVRKCINFAVPVIQVSVFLRILLFIIGFFNKNNYQKVINKMKTLVFYL